MAKSWNAEAEAALRQLVGDVDDAKLTAILELGATWAEIEEAVMWAEGRGETRAKDGHPLTGKVAEIYEILTSDLDDESRLH